MKAAGRPFHFDAPLDLGCGTGLAGAAFPVSVLGSPVSIFQQQWSLKPGKVFYDRLVERRPCRLSEQEAGREARYHLVIAADVFVYVNDLSPIFAAVARVLAPEGLFAFTGETHAGSA